MELKQRKKVDRSGKSNGCYKHGEASTANGRTPEYRAWMHIKNRCYNTREKRYADYGGRGIMVCDEWKDDFQAFLRDMGRRPSPKHSIDRKENDGNYCKDNCRWATDLEQARNQSKNVIVSHNGQSLCVSEWAVLLGLNVKTIYTRLDRGWAPARALAGLERHRRTEPCSS